MKSKHVEIRKHPRIHAKVYMREVAGGAVGWLGSSNLTGAGRSEGGNIEAMAGPLWLTPEFIAEVENLWQNAEIFSIDRMQEEIRQLPPDSEEGGRILAVRVKFRAGLGRCTLRADWLNIKRDSASWEGVTFPTVPYLLPHLVQPYRAQVRSALLDLVNDGARSIGDGIFLFRDIQKPSIDLRLSHLRVKLLKQAKQELGPLKDLQADFKKRFLEVLQQFANKANLALSGNVQKHACEAGLEQFNKYMKSRPFNLEYAFFRHISGGKDESLKKAVSELEAQGVQASMFGPGA